MLWKIGTPKGETQLSLKRVKGENFAAVSLVQKQTAPASVLQCQLLGNGHCLEKKGAMGGTAQTFQYKYIGIKQCKHPRKGRVHVLHSLHGAEAGWASPEHAWEQRGAAAITHSAAPPESAPQHPTEPGRRPALCYFQGKRWACAEQGHAAPPAHICATHLPSRGAENGRKAGTALLLPATRCPSMGTVMLTCDGALCIGVLQGWGSPPSLSVLINNDLQRDSCSCQKALCDTGAPWQRVAISGRFCQDELGVCTARLEDLLCAVFVHSTAQQWRLLRTSCKILVLGLHLMNFSMLEID